MVVNYSKWDALELSDDSDIEVHPNVDKKSFIRAKQNQIHMERDKRRHHIKTLIYERQVNSGLLERIDALLATFREHAARAVGAKPEQFVMNALMDVGLPQDKDRPVDPPADINYKSKQPSYSEMLASLMDQVKQKVGPDSEEWYAKYTAEIQEHKTRVVELQEELNTKLVELEKEETSKITSDSIHDGFSTSSISKDKSKPKVESGAKGKVETVEVLNPAATKRGYLKRLDSGGQTSGADADVDEPIVPGPAGEDEDFEPTELGKKFAKIESSNYKESLQFIGQNPEILAEKETDGLLMEAFNAQMEDKAKYAKQCVHQGLLLQYCRSLGRDGVGLFFKRITTPGHNAQKVFTDDVNQTYARIRSRTAEIKKERALQGEEAGGVEQIQLHAVEPGTEILIQIPQPDSEEEIERQARTIFERFPPGLQRAMESRSLDKINEVLGKMSVSEAEEVVEQMGEHGMLSMEQGVIDGTTEEGQKKLEQLEIEARQGKEGAESPES